MITAVINPTIKCNQSLFVDFIICGALLGFCERVIESDGSSKLVVIFEELFEVW